jgi:hypothetical protein
MQFTVIWDLGDETGPAEMKVHTVNADEALARDPKRYVRHLPDGMKPGPKSGLQRVVLT